MKIIIKPKIEDISENVEYLRTIFFIYLFLPSLPKSFDRDHIIKRIFKNHEQKNINVEKRR